MNTSPDLHHLAAAYALDALTIEEQQAFEAHYPSCEICRREVAEFRETAAVLAEAAGTQPPTGLKSQIMAGVSQTRQLPVILPDHIVDLAERRRLRSGLGSFVLGAAAAAVVAIVGTLAALRAGSGTDDLSDVIAAPDAVFSTLDGSDGTVRVVWSADRSEVAVVGAGLDHPGPDRTYELWFVLTEGGVAPAGLFRPDGDGDVRTLLTVERTDGIGGFGVTVEPDGGSPQPTSDILYSGTL